MNTPRHTDSPFPTTEQPKPSKTAGKPLRLVNAAVVAAHLGVSRGWVYENAPKLGARRLGTGPRARLRFSLADVDAYVASCSAGRESSGPVSRTVTRKRRARSHTGLGTSVPLLPIRGERAA